MRIIYSPIYSQCIFENESEKRSLEKILTVSEVNKFNGQHQLYRFYTKNYSIYSGISFYLKEKAPFPVEIVGYTTDSCIINPSLPNLTLRPYQIEAVKRNIELKRGINNLVTGSGKTAIAAATIYTLNLKSLFVVHTTALAEQTVEEFIKFGFSPDEVGLYSGKSKDLSKKHTIALIQSLYHAVKDNDAALLHFLTTVQVLFIDESHHNSAYSYMEVVKRCPAEYRYGLSGSIFIDENNMTADAFKLIGATGRIINQIDYDLLKNLGYLSDSKAYFYRLPPHQIPADTNDYAKSYKAGIVQNYVRNKRIVEIAKNAFEKHHKVAIIVRQIEHGQILLQLLKELYGIDALFYFGNESVNKIDEDGTTILTLDQKLDGMELSKFKEKDRFILILSPAFFEGIDIPNLSVIIRADAGRSKKNDFQIIGRGLRLKPEKMLYVIDFTDEFNFLFKYQSRKRQKNYEELGIPVKLVG